jgi:preprotein translocase subunit Sss1
MEGDEFRYWLVIILGGGFLAVGSVGWILLAGR